MTSMAINGTNSHWQERRWPYLPTSLGQVSEVLGRQSTSVAPLSGPIQELPKPLLPYVIDMNMDKM